MHDGATHRIGENNCSGRPDTKSSFDFLFVFRTVLLLICFTGMYALFVFCFVWVFFACLFVCLFVFCFLFFYFCIRNISSVSDDSISKYVND